MKGVDVKQNQKPVAFVSGHKMEEIPPPRTNRFVDGHQFKALWAQADATLIRFILNLT